MMATLKENIQQAISDFDGVKAAIEESGVEVPYDTDTSEYGNLVRRAVALASSTIDEDRVREIVGECLADVDTTNFATKDEVSLKADDVLFTDEHVVGSEYGAFRVGDSLQNMTIREIIVKMLNVAKVIEPISGIDEIISNEIPMLSGSEDELNSMEYNYIEFSSQEAEKAPTTSGFYQIVDDGVTSETGYQIVTESTGRANYYIGLLEGITIVDILMWDEPMNTWVDYSPVFTQMDKIIVDGYAYIIYMSADSSSGETLRFIIK